MTFLSYAPNCEDVPLWRALGDVAAGSYVDWGSEPADGASVTRAFYDRGWRGVAVRPTAEQAAQLAAARPRDTVLVASDASRIDTGELHFLRIDADDQSAVLGRIDLVAARPWVVVVRAGDPACDAALAAAGYRSVLFDGVNHFHLAADQAARAPRLAAPANVTDGFLRATDNDAGQLAAMEATLQAMEARLEGRSARLLDAVRVTGQARSDIGVMAGESAWLRGLLDAAQDVEAKLRAETAWLHSQVAAAREATASLHSQLAATREERSGRLLARVEEVAWLRGCLIDSEARVLARVEEVAWLRGCLAESEARAAEQRAAAELAVAEARRRADAMAQSLSWRLTRPLRGAARRLGRLVR